MLQIRQCAFQCGAQRWVVPRIGALIQGGAIVAIQLRARDDPGLTAVSGKDGQSRSGKSQPI